MQFGEVHAEEKDVYVPYDHWDVGSSLLQVDSSTTNGNFFNFFPHLYHLLCSVFNILQYVEIFFLRGGQ